MYMGDGGLIHVDVVGDQMYESVRKTADQIEENIKAVKKQNKKAYVLVSLNKMGKQDSGARKAGQEGFNFMHYDKIAIFSTNLFLKNVANLVAKAIGKTERVKFFKNQEEAVEWLKS